MEHFKITKVKKIGFTHFRGFAGRAEELVVSGKKSGDQDFPGIDTDADIVILTGPNGYGKSSFLEGILLLLTGWHRKIDSPEWMVSFPKTNGKSFEIRGLVETDREGGGEEELVWSYPGKEKPEEIARPFNFPEPGVIDDPELDARMCGFFQDKVESLFDHGTRGKTLRDLFEPNPPHVATAMMELELVPGEFQRKIKELELENKWQGKSVETLVENLCDTWREYNRVLSDAGLAEMEDENAAEASSEEDVFRPILKRLESEGRKGRKEDERLVEKYNELCTGAVENKIVKLKRDRGRDSQGDKSGQTEAIERELGSVRKKIREIETDSPDLEKDILLFEPMSAKRMGRGEAPGLLEILSSLSENAGYWLKSIPAGYPENFKRVLEELEAFDSVEAEKCRQGLAPWIESKKKALEEKQKLEKKAEELEEQLKRAREDKEIRSLRQLKKQLDAIGYHLDRDWRACRDYRRWEEGRAEREKSLKRLGKAKNFVERLKAEYDHLTAPDRKIMKRIKDMLNQVASRFSLVEDFLPLKLEGYDEEFNRKYKIETINGRELEHLSTGQLSQVAVAFLTAQNQAVSSLLNHRIVILDDVTTSYDLSNLTREAVLWRQLAYTDKERQKRQLFISSHHEDLTNHMLELLVPPNGKSMRLIRFVDWSPRTGPVLESFDVVPSEDVGNNEKKTGARIAFASELEKLQWRLN